VGDVPSNVMSVLKKIQDWTLFKTWNELSERDHNIMVSFYDKHWYRNFFTSHHINHTLRKLQKPKYSQHRKKIMKKTGYEISQKGGAAQVKELFGESEKEEDNDDDESIGAEEKIEIIPYEVEEIKETKKDINVFNKVVKKHKEIKDIVPIKFDKSKDNSYEDEKIEELV